MPVYTLIPTAEYGAQSRWTVVGAASICAALADDSDATYIVTSVAGQCAVDLTLSDPVTPSGRLASIGALWRYKRLTGEDYAWLGLYDVSVGNPSVGKLWAGYSTSWVTQELLAHQGVNPAALQTPTSPNDIVAEPFGSAVAGSLSIAQIKVMAYYLPAVTCSAPSAPSGTVTATQMPTCTVPLSLVVESWQLPSGAPAFLTGGDVEFAIYRSADAPGATPPAGVTPVWTRAVRFSEATLGTRTESISATPDVPLPNGNYVLYARASRDLMSGSQLNWSSWVKGSAWAQQAILPTAPTVTAAAETPAQRIALTVNCPATSGFDSSTCEVSVQRLLADGSWRDVRAARPLALATGVEVTCYDYEGDRAATNTYRARSSMLLTADGIRYYSAWQQASATGPAVTGWNLKAADDPSLSWLGASVLSDPGEEDQGESGVFKPLDRELPVVVSGTLAGAGGSLELDCSGSAAITLAEALRAQRGLVLLETAFGDAKYIAITKWSWVRQGTAANPWRVYSLSYAEVACDLATASV